MTSGNSALFPKASYAAVGTVNAAIVALAKAFADLGIRDGVRVNSVLPGPTSTEGVGEFFATLARDAGKSLAETEHDFFKFARPTSLLQRFIEPAEIAAMVTYICSPRSSATNGAALHAEGGVVRSLI